MHATLIRSCKFVEFANTNASVDGHDAHANIEYFFKHDK